MFQYEYEKPRRPASMLSCDSSATTARAEWRAWPAPVPRPAQPAMCRQLDSRASVPLKVWIVAIASCFAVCAILVLATLAITKWGTSESYSGSARFYSEDDNVLTNQKPVSKYIRTTEAPNYNVEDDLSSEDEINRLDPILEKLPLFKNIVANRNINKDSVRTEKPKKDNLMTKPQFHPEHDTTLDHAQRKIEKKDQPKGKIERVHPKPFIEQKIPEFKPTLPDVFINKHTEIKLPDGYLAGLRKFDADVYEDYFYNDENLYEDYMQSTSMTSYLIEKVQELHDWISNDSDFDVVRNITGKNRKSSGNEFSLVLKALNETIVEGNITIIMTKLKDIFYGDNYTVTTNKKIILTNRTDLLSFGILTLDIILLHNIQLMAWENQENIQNKMLRDPDVFAFNALFMDPTKVESKRNELFNLQEPSQSYPKRQSHRIEQLEDDSISANLIENMLDLGMSTARAAIHLGRAYKNTKSVLNQITNRDTKAQPLAQIPRHIDANTHALNHLQTSYKNNGSVSPSDNEGFYTELDCVWLLYCRNLVATGKLGTPYGVMARINGVALRMLSGELSSDKAIDTLLYEAFTGWTELRCNDMFPRCSKGNASSVVLDSILQPTRKVVHNKTR